MKKVIVILVMFLSFSLSKAQTGFDAGVHFGLPLGDSGDAYSFNLALDAEYMFSIADQFKLGIGSGYDMWFGKSVEVLGVNVDIDDAQFIPATAVLKFMPTEKFLIGGNIGYAIGISDGNDGGFLYMPKLGYTAEFFDIYAFYKGISVKGGNFGSIGAGFMYKF